MCGDKTLVEIDVDLDGIVEWWEKGHDGHVGSLAVWWVKVVVYQQHLKSIHIHC